MVTESDTSREPGAPEVRREVVDEASAGTRVDHFLSERLEISRAEARRLMAHGRVRAAGRPLELAAKGRAVTVGTVFEVADFLPGAEERIRPEPQAGAVNGILAQGAGWIAVDKVAGAPVHPLAAREGRTVLNQVISHFPELQGVGEAGLRSGVVHRLDVDTSGVLLVAIRQDAWERLRAAFSEHRVEKVYRAIVLGDFTGPGQVELGLQVARHRPARVRVVPVDVDAPKKGVWVARQSIEKIESLAGASLIEVRPETGFLHQIRATLAHLGHPLAGDAAYLDGRPDPSGACRHQLHAASVRFEEVSASSPDPEDFRSTLRALR